MAALPTKRQDSEYLSTLERGLSVLRAFNQSRPEMQLSEVAAATGLSPAVARRCLNTLVHLGYVARHGRRFLLRPEVLVFGSAFLASMNIEEVAGPHLQAVPDQTVAVLVDGLMDLEHGQERLRRELHRLIMTD